MINLNVFWLHGQPYAMFSTNEIDEIFYSAYM